MQRSWIIGLDRLMFIAECRALIQAVVSSKIQLASLRLGGTALVWWKGRTQLDIKKHGKILSLE